MRRVLFVLLVVLASSVLAQAGYTSLGEAFSLRDGQERLEVGYRQHTAPSLTEFGEKDIVVQELNVSPTEIRLAVGEAYRMDQLAVTTFGPDGEIEEHVPMTLDLEGPADLVDYDAWRTYGEELIGARAGAATIWIVSLAPSSTGEYIRQAVRLVVY